MQLWNKKTIWLMFLVLFSGPKAMATKFSNGIDTSSWRAKSSVFECRISHVIPYYGEAIFQTRAGERSQFYLNASSSRLRSGQAALTSQSPIYVEQAAEFKLGFVPVKQGLRPIVLNSHLTEQLLIELKEGKDLYITREPWYTGRESTRLGIATIGFRAVYEEYLGCLAGLLPSNFDQLERTTIYVSPGAFEDFRASELRKLDHIAAYVKADPSVKRFFVDGHTDSLGSRAENLALSQKRAEEITRYLVNKGIPEANIVSRWHGERYPVASNANASGRAKNRRVTVRLEKVDPSVMASNTRSPQSQSKTPQSQKSSETKMQDKDKGPNKGEQ